MDFYQEVLKRKDKMLKDLIELCAINSETEGFNPNFVSPFGNGLKKAVDKMMEIGKREGFKVFNDDYYAMHIEYGNYEDYVCAIGHLDVVPAIGNWTHPPYEPTIVGDILYARGSEDDKSGTIASLYAMIILKELGIKLSKNIRLICGCDEETNWRCVEHYFTSQKQPTAGFVPDTHFPLCYAEKGIATLKLSGSYDNSIVASIIGGTKDNMVPDACWAVLNKENLDKEFEFFLNSSDYQGDLEYLNHQAIIKIYGKSAHGSLPHHGLNAIFGMIKFLNFLKIKNDLINLINDYFLDSFFGEKLGIYAQSNDLGTTTLNLGVINAKEGFFEIQLNTRYPQNVSFKWMFSKIEEEMRKRSVQIEVIKNLDCVFYPKDSTLVQTLMSIYKKQTADTSAVAYAMGGGTFARAAKNVVAFGPSLKNSLGRAHQTDEGCSISDLMRATAIYAEAFYELAK